MALLCCFWATREHVIYYYLRCRMFVSVHVFGACLFCQHSPAVVLSSLFGNNFVSSKILRVYLNLLILDSNFLILDSNFLILDSNFLILDSNFLRMYPKFSNHLLVCFFFSDCVWSLSGLNEFHENLHGDCFIFCFQEWLEVKMIFIAPLCYISLSLFLYDYASFHH